MNPPKIWLSSPDMGGDEFYYINQAFQTNWIAPVGLNIDSFETDLQDYLNQDIQTVALHSGTAALHLALVLLQVQKDDVVICQSMTFSASANPILYQGATPIFVDSEMDTWNICPKALEQAIDYSISKGKRPKAIIAVHLYGMPYKVEEINKIAQKHQIPIIEDAAEALGSSFRNQKCGTFGAYGVLSFNGNKIITTSGGGALVVKDIPNKQKTIFYATQAKDSAVHYQHSEIGYNYRMSNVLAGIGRGQMKVLERHIEKRRANNLFYRELFSKYPKIQLQKEPHSDYYSNYWLSCILTDSYSTREAIRLALEQENIESRPLWKPLHLQPVFEQYPYFGTNIANNLFERGLCLPSGSNMTNQDRQRIKNVLLKVL
ncbi:MAG: aminotransferase class I/II-fold pyridoxal phosphate-dependent enzyme [Bacteroidota bacterium]|nr:aminotransferase class I/II-fold pyridoxal phosphate-dependent enzyme [Bacteroidota bacterium]